MLRPVLPLGEYILNYEYIAKELCVNKEKPAMHCNGKCHLMKELAKKAADENPSSEKKGTTLQYEVLAIVEQPLSIPFSLTTIYNVSPANTYKNLYSHNYTPVSFRPPGLV
nr:hypothetical protein [Flavobacterium sp. Sd200]